MVKLKLVMEQMIMSLTLFLEYASSGGTSTGGGFTIHLATTTLSLDSTTRIVLVLSENRMNFYSNGVQLGSGVRLLKE